ncbi:MAG: nucleotidyltransferase domain-containing protein [Lentisphaerae bacterium]|nr:nucleotidyltransferase domain-containing protein [Lentisphaerota bacterium]
MDFAPASERLAADARILAAYALGSAVRNSLRPDSDIDIGILPFRDDSLSAVEIQQLAADLSVSFRRPVDLGVVSSANLIYSRQCLLGGTRIFCRDPGRAELRAASLLGMSMQFDLDRREVVHAYSA